MPYGYSLKLSIQNPMGKNLVKKPIFWAVLIFVAAAYFRIFFLDLIEFKYDEAYTVFELTKFYSSPSLMQVGPPQSTGVYNPPLFNYLMIFLSLPSRDPQYLSFMIALINSISIVAFYLVVRKFINNRTAIFSSFILALSPWSIIFSRKIWIPDLILPFMVLFLYFFLKRSYLPLFIILALLIQMHASGLFFALATVSILLILKIKIQIKPALLGFAIGLIPAIPYFFRQLTSDPFCIDCAAFINYQAIPKPFDIYVFLRPWQLLSGLNFEVLLGSDYLEFIQTLPVLGYLPLLGYLISLLGAAFIIKSERRYLFLVFYLLLVPLFYFISRTPSYMHYFAILIPLAALMCGFVFSFVWGMYKSYINRILVAATFLAFLGTNIIFTQSLYGFLSSKQTINGDFGTIFPNTREFVEDQVKDYRLLKDYELIKSYAFMFAKPEIIHGKLGELFIRGGNANLSIAEFKKALEVNPKDTFSRSNLTYIYIMTGKKDDAQKELAILETYDGTASAKLKTILEGAKK